MSVNNSRFKKILTILFLFLFISSGTITDAYSSLFCDDNSCCETACCNENSCCEIPEGMSYTSENNCCNINESAQNDLKETQVCITPANNIAKASLMFASANIISFKEINLNFNKVYSFKPPAPKDLKLSLRI